MSSLRVVILAAGQGKRMHSELPKVLHLLGGKPILAHVIQTALQISAEPMVVYGHQGELIRETLKHYPVKWVEQKEQLGTGHALLQVLPDLQENEDVLVLYGDVPLISVKTIQQLITSAADGIRLLTAKLNDPTGYGRIVRDKGGHVRRIVEEKDARENERLIKEINTGIWIFPAKFLQKYLPLLQTNNQQQEYYLTDVVAPAVEAQLPIHTMTALHQEELLGVNDRLQLAYCERYYQRKRAKQLMRTGVTLYDPERLDIRGDVIIGQDVTIDVNVILEGQVSIGNRCQIGANVILRNVRIADDVEVKPFSCIEGAEIDAQSKIGPFARIRPGTLLAKGTHVGNFVEIKNSMLGTETKVNHLSYIGDSEIGKCVNVGAGTITCNYDGFKKHKTIIEDNVHIGSDTQLVAPVRIGAGATIGAGSTITKDAPPNKLVLTHRLDQRTIDAWARSQLENKDM